MRNFHFTIYLEEERSVLFDCFLKQGIAQCVNNISLEFPGELGSLKLSILIHQNLNAGIVLGMIDLNSRLNKWNFKHKFENILNFLQYYFTMKNVIGMPYKNGYLTKSTNWKTKAKWASHWMLKNLQQKQHLLVIKISERTWIWGAYLNII